MLWVVRVMVVLGALLSAGIGVLGLIAPGSLLAVLGYPGEHVTSATVQLAAYVGARELPIAVMLLVLVLTRSRRVLPATMLLFAVSNAIDAVDALAFQRWAQLPGAAALAIVFGMGAFWLVRQPPKARIA